MKNQYHCKSQGLHLCLWLATILFAFPLSAQQQIGRPLITNYKYQDYLADPVNWWVLEDENGIMYFANNNGVLQYDGVNWDLVDTDALTRSMAKDKDGVIHVGGQGDLGYLATTETGKLEYVSLVDKIPEEHRAFEDVWEIDYYKGRIIYRTEFKLYCWDGENMKITNIGDDDEIRVVTTDKFTVINGHPHFDTQYATIKARPAAEEYIKHTYREGWEL